MGMSENLLKTLPKNLNTLGNYSDYFLVMIHEEPVKIAIRLLKIIHVLDQLLEGN